MNILTGIVRIQGLRGNRGGTGFVVSDDGLIVTCAHVLGEDRAEKALVVFQSNREPREATVMTAHWRAKDAEDLALLKVVGPLPPGVQPLPFGTSLGTQGHAFRTFGYPDTGEVQGIVGSGMIQGDGPMVGTGFPLLQLSSNEITRGFSGAPVWDEARQRVVGIVVMTTTTDRDGKMADVALATPTEIVQRLYPDLFPVHDICPYRNLEAFTENDAALFYGRERVIVELLESLQRQPRFLTVLGASGSGKSSVVQAGLIPQLRQEAVVGSNHRNIIVTRPTNPSFRKILTDVDTTATPVILVIDQFEEIFTSYDETATGEVLQQLAHFLEHRAHIVLLLVIRDDFLARLFGHEGLAKWLNRHLFHVPPALRPEEVEAIIRKPAELMGWKFEEGLVEMLVNDVTEIGEKGPAKAGRSTTLPLLEFTLTQLWQHQRDGFFTLQAYKSIGGIVGGLRKWADDAYCSFDEPSQFLARRIFTDLIHYGDEDQHIAHSRRRKAFSTLIYKEEEKSALSQIVQHLLARRLLVISQERENDPVTVEIIHDALVWEWERLKDWLEEKRDFLIWRQQGFEKRVRAWEKSTKDDPVTPTRAKLLEDDDLLEAEHWVQTHATDLSQREVAYIRTSQRHQQEMERRKKSKRQIFIAATILMLLALLGSTIEAVWSSMQIHSPDYVFNTSNDGTGSLRWAIKNAPSNSTITFAPMLRGQTILLTTTDIHITQQNLTIQGPATGRITIQLRRVSIVVDKAAMVTISDIDFQGSHANFVSVIQNAGKLTLKMCSISGNTASEDVGAGPFTNTSGAIGGGIDNIGVLSLTNSTLSNNTVSSSSPTGAFGGGIFNSGTVTLTNSTLSGNTASSSSSKSSGFGGGIDNGGTLTLINSTISNNTASGFSSKISGGGGGIDNAGTLTLTHSTISNNTVRVGTGGGIMNNGTATLTNSTISGNTTSGSGTINASGGGVANSGMLTLTHSTISNNTASGFSVGGGIFNISKVTLINSTLSNNTASDGGGIANDDTATLTNSTLSGNTASDGGGVANTGSFTLINCTLSHNIASSHGDESAGGGIFNNGTITLTDSILSDNTAFSSNRSDGGGIANTGALSLINSTLSDNTAFYGGNIATTGQTADKPAKTASVTLMFCTLVNEKDVTHDGFDITIEENDPPIGPEVMFQLVMKATIVGGNSTQVSPIIGVITSGGYNVIQNMSSVQFTVNSAHTTDHSIITLTNVFGSAPALQKNGGPTETYSLIPDTSDPAFNAVPLAACTDIQSQPIHLDQRGLPRPGAQTQACDSGAYEYQVS